MISNYYPLSISQTLICAIILFGIHYVYHYCTTEILNRQLAASKNCQPVRKWNNLDPIFGLDALWKIYKAVKSHTMLELTQKRFAEGGGNTATFRFLGTTIISTMEPENLKTVLATNFQHYSLGDNRKKLLTPFLGEGIFTTDGAEWQHSRDMLRPNFVRTQIGDIEMFERHVQNVIRALPRDGSMVDLQGVFFGMSLDVATEFLFGTSTGVMGGGDVDEGGREFVEAFTYAQNHIEGSTEGGWGILELWLPNRKLKMAHKTVHSFVDNLITKALTNQSAYESQKHTSPNPRYIFLHELCTNPTTPPPKIRSELLNILLAGRDTTASLLTNLWFELSSRPTLWSRLSSEVATLNNTLPSFEQLKDMKYLRAVINESLRLYPVVPENGRQAELDTVLPLGGGEDGKGRVFVRKGTLVAWSLWCMHRRKDLFGDDAEVFRPERWLDGGDGEGEKGLRVGWEFLPFNGGPRICIGQQFALMEASYITVRLMQEFSGIESRDSEPWREKVSLTCTNLGGCKVVLKPRS